MKNVQEVNGSLWGSVESKILLLCFLSESGTRRGRRVFTFIFAY